MHRSLNGVREGEFDVADNLDRLTSLWLEATASTLQRGSSSCTMQKHFYEGLTLLVILQSGRRVAERLMKRTTTNSARHEGQMTTLAKMQKRPAKLMQSLMTD